MVDGLPHFVEIALLAVAALLPIVDPLGGAPIYLALTRGVDPAAREPLAKLVAFDSFLLLLASALFGSTVFNRPTTMRRYFPQLAAGQWDKPPVDELTLSHAA